MTREQVPQDFQIVLPPPAEPGAEPLRLCISESDEDITACACISSDQTGWLTASNGIETITIYALFVDGDSIDACPLSYNQLPLEEALPTALLLMFLVDMDISTHEQVDALRLKPVMYSYADPNLIGGSLNINAAVQYASSM